MALGTPKIIKLYWLKTRSRGKAMRSAVGGYHNPRMLVYLVSVLGSSASLWLSSCLSDSAVRHSQFEEPANTTDENPALDSAGRLSPAA
jgi:hypothetical protein